jgi:HK97 family phage prohead protease
MQNEVERRFQPRSRSAATSNSNRSVSGYAATFGNRTDIGGMFWEVIRPGAFARAIRQKQDAKLLINHDPSQILGRVRNDTLSLTEDSRGLRFKCGPVPNTRAGQDLLTLLSNQTLSECSFGFRCPENGDRWSKVVVNGQTRDLRELCDVDLLDCSIVTYPQYSNTAADVDPDDAEADPDRNLKAMAAFASSSAPAELRSRVAAAIQRGPIDAEEADLLRRARIFLTHVALLD